MKNVKDFLLKDFDLIIENGDFKIGDSDLQSLELIIKNNIGSFKNNPLMGVGIDNYIASNGTKNIIKSKITKQVIADGFEINSFDIVNDNYYIDVKRIK